MMTYEHCPLASAYVTWFGSVAGRWHHRPSPVDRRPRCTGYVRNLQRSSKTRCASLNGLLWLLECDAKGNKVVGVNDRKLFGIRTALETERFVFGAVDVNDLTWFKANPNPCRRHVSISIRLVPHHHV